MIALAIEKRLHASRALRAAVTLGSLSLALFLGGAVIAAVGVNPCGAYAALCRGAFGTSYGLSETVVKAIPLLFCGLSVSLALRMRLWNIGAEGQYVVGALAASLVALVIPGLGRVSYFALMLLASFAAGALWGGIPGALRARLNVSEIITTLLMNWVAIYLIQFFVYGPLRGADGFPFTSPFPPPACLMRVGWGRVHAGAFLAAGAAVVLQLLLAKTVWGFEVKVIGDSPECARYAGMAIRKNIFLVMTLAGGLSGISGFCQVAGVECRIPREVFAQYGYTAIVVAWLAKARPLGVAIVAFLFGGLLTGGEMIQIELGVPASVINILTGSILFFLLAGDLFLNYRIVARRAGTARAAEGHIHG
ncbi:MAG: ABC transporter permease [Chlamydiota bacterium]